MASMRAVRVRLDVMTNKHFLLSFAAAAVAVAIAMGVGLAGPVMNVTQAAGTSGTGVILTSSYQQCMVNAQSEVMPAVPYCWNHAFIFSTRWVQYFEVRLLPHASPVDTDVTLNVLWQGQKSAGGGFDVLYNGTVNRRAECRGGECNDIMLFRTSSVPYNTYFFQISLDGAQALAANSWLQTADFAFRYRNPDFSQFELGFKVTWMLISLLVLAIYVGVAACDCSCRRPAWVCLCCQRGQNNPLSFQRQEGLNWIYALLVAVFLFNEPLLWCTYYAPAQIFKLISVAMQLTFIAVMLSYWLVEFGLLKSNQQAHQTISCVRFYLPKMIAMFLYWVMALAIYGFVLFRQSEDPTYDWTEYRSAPLFLAVWSGLLALLYVLYLTWTIMMSCARIRTFRRPELYLFGTHLIVVVATVLGLAAGGIYGYDIKDAFSFMLFNALYNSYIFLLAYLYTPLSYQQLEGCEPEHFGMPSPDGGSMTGGVRNAVAVIDEIEAQPSGNTDGLKGQHSQGGTTGTARPSIHVPGEQSGDSLPDHTAGDDSIYKEYGDEEEAAGSVSEKPVSDNHILATGGTRDSSAVPSAVTRETDVEVEVVVNDKDEDSGARRV